MIEVIRDEQVLAYIVRSGFHRDGVVFFTPNDYSQQLGYMSHPAGHQIVPHIHKKITRAVTVTNEVLFLKNGKLRVDFYSEQNDYLESRVLERGDCILLVSGGHGFEALEDVQLVEVKQGPYIGESDKERIPAVSKKDIRFGDDRLGKH